jgi:hypothetical protein
MTIIKVNYPTEISIMGKYYFGGSWGKCCYIENNVPLYRNILQEIKCHNIGEIYCPNIGEMC